MVTRSLFEKERLSQFILLFGDLLALFLFVYAGQRTHDMAGLSRPFLRLLTTGENSLYPGS